MSVTTAVGYPQLKDYGFIPTIYTSQVNIKYYAECLLPRITNSKFTGEVKNQGDKVIITQRPTIVVSNYSKGQELEQQVPTSVPLELNVDRAKSYCFIIDTVDEKQSHISMGQECVADAVKQMDIAINTDFFADIYAYAHADNQGATAGAKSHMYNLGAVGAPFGVNKNNALEYLTQFKSVLKEQNATNAKLWVAIPEWMNFVLLNSDIKNAMLMGDPKSVLRTGLVGSLLDMDIYSSNLMHDVTDSSKACTYVVGGNQDAITYCAQLTKARAHEAEKKFGIIYDGLYVYDWKVVKPEGLVTSLAYKA